jgi:hypothetical protein
MMMEKFVELLAGENEVLGENLFQCRFVHHKPHMSLQTRTRAASVGSKRLTARAKARPDVYLRNLSSKMAIIMLLLLPLLLTILLLVLISRLLLLLITIIICK